MLRGWARRGYKSPENLNLNPKKLKFDASEVWTLIILLWELKDVHSGASSVDSRRRFACSEVACVPRRFKMQGLVVLGFKGVFPYKEV